MSRSLYDKLYKRFGPTLSESELTSRSEKLVEAEHSHWATASVPSPCQSRLKQTRVAIVGGGFAGTMAAWWLCQREKGMEVVLFEARDDVGGRVSSDDTFTEGRVIEFGAELVGANHPVWLNLARDFGIGLMTRTGEEDYALMGLEMKFRVDGKDLDEKAAKQLESDMKKAFVAIGKDARQIKRADQPWNQPDLQAKFDNMSVADKLTKPAPIGLGVSKDKLLYKSFQMLLGNNLVVPLEKINYLALLCLVKGGQFGSDKEDPDFLGFWQVTESFRCTDGCQTMVRRMVGNLTDAKQKYKFTFLPKTPVRAITVDPVNRKPVMLKWDRSVAADKAKPDPSFDYVILAVPPSVWGDIAISPEHPKDTIGALQMGPAVKFFSNLKDRFWIREKAAPSGISSEIGMIWEGTDNQTLVGKQEIELSVFAGGVSKSGRILTESEFMTELKKLYPGYTDSNRRKKTRLVSWPTEAFIKTGYSCPRLGHMFTAGPQLQKPLNSGRLFLAGEHTQPDFFGFMEGALRSGRRAAEAVIAKVCPEVDSDFPNA